MLGVIVGLSLLVVTLCLFVTGGYFQRKHDDNTTFYFVTGAVVLLFVSCIWNYNAFSEKIVCPVGTQKVNSLSQLGTTSTLTMCLTPEQISTFLGSRTVIK